MSYQPAGASHLCGRNKCVTKPTLQFIRFSTCISQEILNIPLGFKDLGLYYFKPAFNGHFTLLHV